MVAPRCASVCFVTWSLPAHGPTERNRCVCGPSSSPPPSSSSPSSPSSVTTNAHSATCSEQLRYERWEGPLTEAQRCRAVESISQDWSLFALHDQLETPPLLPMYTFPTVDVSTMEVRQEGSVYSPVFSDCTENATRPLALPLINVSLSTHIFPSNPTVTRYRIFILIAAVYPHSELLLNLQSWIPANYTRYLAAGSASFSHCLCNGTADFRLLSTSWTGPYASITGNVLNLYVRLLPQLLNLWMLQACADFALKRHLQSCLVCTKTSPATITWIIVLGIVQAITSIATVTAWLIRKCNRDKVITEEDSHAAHPQQLQQQMQQQEMTAHQHNNLRQLLLNND